MKLNIKFTIVIIAAITIPVAIFAGILFYNLEENTIQENISYMDYKMDKNAEEARTCIDSVNMSTQFFLSDEEMKRVLEMGMTGEALTTEELVSFQMGDVKNLERLVSNNPLLYAVRIYSAGENVQEMMPVLYKRSRMDRLAFAEGEEQDVDLSGWHFGYTDTIFSSLISEQEKELAGLVTPVTDHQLGLTGLIEATVTMQDMFPGLYEEGENEWGCFITDTGEVYYGSNGREEQEEIRKALVQKLNEENLLSMDESVSRYYKLDHRKLIVTAKRNREFSGTVLAVKDITEDVQKVYTSRNIFVGVMLFLMVGVAFLINFIVQRMLRQFYMILQSMRQVEKGDLSVRIDRCSNDEMGELGSQLNRMLDRIQDIMQENINREVLVKNSEIRALQNQINAHFIYNVLESVKMMAEIDEEYEISDAITALGRLLRYSMKWTSKNVMLKDELEYIRNYMALINLRYDFTIQLSLNIPEELMQQEIPKMSLQPVVENAILHGIEPLGLDSTIYIKAWKEEKDCIIEISDAGQGMSEEDLKVITDRLHGKVEASMGKGGIGLKNVHDRIRLEFGSQYGLTVYTRQSCYTKVRIRLPEKRLILAQAGVTGGK